MAKFNSTSAFLRLLESIYSCLNLLKSLCCCIPFYSFGFPHCSCCLPLFPATLSTHLAVSSISSIGRKRGLIYGKLEEFSSAALEHEERGGKMSGRKEEREQGREVEEEHLFRFSFSLAFAHNFCLHVMPVTLTSLQLLFTVSRLGRHE